MFDEIDGLVTGYDSGRVTRRQLITGLGALVVSAMAAPGVRPATSSESTLQATGLNHLALRVPDVPRARAFYQKHLGLGVLRSGERTSFLSCGGNHFLALFRSAEAGLDHYCYTVRDFEPGQVMKKLGAAGLGPERHQDRIYFEDGDGLTVQVTGEWDDYPGTRP